MPASNTIVLKSLSILLGLFFVFVGTLKLTPHISKDLYKDLVSIVIFWKIDSKIKIQIYCECVFVLS